MKTYKTNPGFKKLLTIITYGIIDKNLQNE